MLTDLFDIIWSLPIENRTIFSWLMLCLFGVSLCEEKTKMGPENIALVFGPNLMRFSANPTPTESMKVCTLNSVIYIDLSYIFSFSSSFLLGLKKTLDA